MRYAETYIKILVILTSCFRPEDELNSKIALESVYVADNNNQRSDQQCGDTGVLLRPYVIHTLLLWHDNFVLKVP